VIDALYRYLLRHHFDPLPILDFGFSILDCRKKSQSLAISLIFPLLPQLKIGFTQG
jgi:hypothetical protein